MFGNASVVLVGAVSSRAHGRGMLQRLECVWSVCLSLRYALMRRASRLLLRCVALREARIAKASRGAQRRRRCSLRCRAAVFGLPRRIRKVVVAPRRLPRIELKQWLGGCSFTVCNLAQRLRALDSTLLNQCRISE